MHKWLQSEQDTSKAVEDKDEEEEELEDEKIVTIHDDVRLNIVLDLAEFSVSPTYNPLIGEENRGMKYYDKILLFFYYYFIILFLL